MTTSKCLFLGKKNVHLCPASSMVLTFSLTSVLPLHIIMYWGGSGMKLSNQNVLFISQWLASICGQANVIFFFFWPQCTDTLYNALDTFTSYRQHIIIHVNNMPGNSSSWVALFLSWSSIDCLLYLRFEYMWLYYSFSASR